MTSNINRSHEVIKGIKQHRVTRADLAHAYAFGWIWGMLTEEQRQEVLDRFPVKEEN